MATKTRKLTTLEVIKNGEQIFHRLRWAYGIVVCPYCGSMNICEHDGYRYKCNSCKRRFNDKTRTLMHGSKLPVYVWMQAIYEMSVDNYISSNVLATKLGINQKSAWLLMTKLRYAMPQDKVLLEGTIAQDEMYVGGCLSNFHYSRKLDLLRKGNYIGKDDRKYGKEAIFALNSTLKQPVFGMNDGNRIVLYATPNPIKSDYIKSIYQQHAQDGSVVVSDESKLYKDWEGELYTNNHHNNQYMTKEGYTSNRIENTFSWFKRGFVSRVTHCKYHQFYLNEFVFRYNHRNIPTEDVFNDIISSTIGKHITYKGIKAYNQFAGFKIPKKKELSEDIMKSLLESGAVMMIEQNHKKYTKEVFE